MPQGEVLVLHRDLESPSQWEDDNFFFDFKNYADIMGGQALSGVPAIVAATPTGATALTIGVRTPPTINGTQVIFSITLPNNAPSGYTYSLSCTVGTTAGNRIEQAGTLLAIDST